MENEKHEGSRFLTIPWRMIHEGKLSATSMLLFGLIVLYSDKEGYCTASNSYLANELKLTERSVMSLLHELESSGYITRIPQDENQGRLLYANLDWRGVKKISPGGEENFRGGEKNFTPQLKKENLSSSLASPLSSSLNNPISNPTPNSYSLEKKEQQVIGSSYVNTLDKGCGEKNTETDDGVCVQTLFERFWCEYPKKVGKKDALKAFMRIANLEDTFPKIMDALAKFKTTPEWKAENGRYIPYPATWIHGERWNDEIHEDKWVALDRELRQKHPEWYEKKEDGFDDGLI